MSESLTRDADALHRALGRGGEVVEVSLSRATAELISRVIDARVRGQEVFVTRGHTEVTPNEAADLLGMSRPQVRKLMDAGELGFRKVGTHHRIRVASIRAFLDAERERRAPILAELAKLQNESGLLE